MGGLVKGGNTFVPSAPLRIAVRHGLDATALLLDDGGTVREDGDIVFHGQPEHPSGAVRLTGDDDGTEWLEVDLPTVEPDITRVLLVGSTEVGTLRDVTEPSVEAFAPDGTSVIRYEVTDAADETALVFAELYRRAGGWKFRAVGQGYADGLTGLARDHGVDVAEPGVAPAPEVVAPAAAYPVEWTFGADFAPYVVVGRDDDVVTVGPSVPPGPVLVDFVAEETDFVGLSLVDKRGRKLAYVAHGSVPDFRGRFLVTLPDEGPPRLRVQAQGLWRLSVLPLSHARRLGEAREGWGSEPLLHTTGPTNVTLRHEGAKSVFLYVHAVDEAGLTNPRCLVNESSGYRGTVQLPGGPLIVELAGGEGPWSMTPDDPAATRNLPAPRVTTDPHGPAHAAPAEAPWTFGADFTPFAWTGRGEAQVTVAPDVPPGPVILELIVRGGKRISLHTLNEHGYSENELLSQWEGDGFRGRYVVVVPQDRPLGVEVRADEDWQLRVLPVSHARRLHEARQGHGPEVLLHTTGPADLTFHHRGEGSVALWSHQVDGEAALPHPHFLLGEAGERVDTAPLHRGPVILALKGDVGDWSTALEHVLWPAGAPVPHRARELPTAPPAPLAPPVMSPQEFGPVFAPFAVTGQNSSVITVPPSVPPGPVIVELSTRGNGYTGLHVLDRHNAEREALVSSTHPGFRGRVLTEVPDDGPLRLSLKAEHGWKLSVLPLAEARHLGEPLTGNGPEVLWHTAGTADLTVRYQGEDELIADLIEVRGRRDLPPSRSLINENGRREETVPLPEGPALVEFTRADGPWAVELRNVRPPSAAPADVLEPVPTRHHAPGTAVDTATGGVRGWLHGPVFTPFTTEGRGERVVTLRNVPAGPVLLEFAHEGDGYVECKTLSMWNREEDHVFSTSVSRVRLTALVTSPKHRPLRMRIHAEGSWTVRVLPLSAARELTGTLTGEAPEVLRYSGPAADLHLDVKTRRDTYTLLRGYEVEGTSELPEGDTLISEHGRLSAIRPLPRGPLLLQFAHVEGVWTMTAHPTVSKS
ncbi:TerD family protein [Streptomyces sp. NPDC058171]